MDKGGKLQNGEFTQGLEDLYQRSQYSEAGYTDEFRALTQFRHLISDQLGACESQNDVDETVNCIEDVLELDAAGNRPSALELRQVIFCNACRTLGWKNPLINPRRFSLCEAAKPFGGDRAGVSPGSPFFLFGGMGISGVGVNGIFLFDPVGLDFQNPPITPKLSLDMFPSKRDGVWAKGTVSLALARETGLGQDCEILQLDDGRIFVDNDLLMGLRGRVSIVKAGDLILVVSEKSPKKGRM